MTPTSISAMLFEILSIRYSTFMTRLRTVESNGSRALSLFREHMINQFINNLQIKWQILIEVSHT